MLFIDIQKITHETTICDIKCNKICLEPGIIGYPLIVCAADGISVLLPQPVTAKEKTDTNLDQMYSRNCNLSPMMLVLSLVIVQLVQYKLIFTLKCCFKIYVHHRSYTLMSVDKFEY